jgi:hypothetical protein
LSYAAQYLAYTLPCQRFALVAASESFTGARPEKPSARATAGVTSIIGCIADIVRLWR